MRKTFQYRLYPTRGQKQALQITLNACRWVYNETLATRKNAYEHKGKSPSLYETSKLLPGWKKDKPELTNAHSQCLQNAQLRVDLAFKAFFRRVKAGEEPGYPRFKGFNRYDSFTFPQPSVGYKPKDGRLKIFKVGAVKIKLHRNLEGKIKNLTIHKTATSKWFACFSCEVEPKPLKPIDTVVGVDVGLESFATLSTGKKIPNPRFFKTDEKKIAKTQCRIDKATKGKPQKPKARRAVALAYEKTTNRRKDFAHKLSLALVKKYGFIAFEKLEIQKMQKNGFKGIRKSIGDVAWGKFMQFTVYKAENAGRTVAFVAPRNTSKRCSRCGQLVEKKLSDRVHRCPCGLVMDRDKNAAINILALGLQGQELSPRSHLL